jgi:Na+(H+)/acetate symporter ActP
MAIAFEQMLGLWVFMASILISSVTVPIIFGLYVKNFRKPMAGLLSAGLGLLSTIILNVLVMSRGVFLGEEETYVLQLGRWEIMQEYIMYFTVPISLMGFFIGLLIDKGKNYE